MEIICLNLSIYSGNTWQFNKDSYGNNSMDIFNSKAYRKQYNRGSKGYNTVIYSSAGRLRIDPKVIQKNPLWNFIHRRNTVDYS